MIWILRIRIRHTVWSSSIFGCILLRNLNVRRRTFIWRVGNNLTVLFRPKPEPIESARASRWMFTGLLLSPVLRRRSLSGLRRKWFSIILSFRGRPRGAISICADLRSVEFSVMYSNPHFHLFGLLNFDTRLQCGLGPLDVFHFLKI